MLQRPARRLLAARGRSEEKVFRLAAQRRPRHAMRRPGTRSRSLRSVGREPAAGATSAAMLSDKGRVASRARRLPHGGGARDGVLDAHAGNTRASPTQALGRSRTPTRAAWASVRNSVPRQGRHGIATAVEHPRICGMRHRRPQGNRHATGERRALRRSPMTGAVRLRTPANPCPAPSPPPAAPHAAQVRPWPLPEGRCACPRASRWPGAAAPALPAWPRMRRA